MSTVSTWTGWEATALRRALRMSVTEFAAHVGVARRTAAKWSSQGRDVVLRAEMQAALDTVLGRSAAEVRERFDQLRSTSGPPRDDRPTTYSMADDGTRSTSVDRMLDVLFTDNAGSPESGETLQQLRARVGRAKSHYQACHYDSAADELVVLLPLINAAMTSAAGEWRAASHAVAADAYQVSSSILLKVGESTIALLAAERSSRCAADSGDPVAVGAAARIMTHALINNGHLRRAMDLSEAAAGTLERDTHLMTADAGSVYGALLLRGAVAAARADDRDTADTMLAEAARIADRLGGDGNERWTGFGPTNVLQHRANLALALGDAGTSIAYARQVQPDTVPLVERRAALFIDMARAYTQWGRHAQALLALRHAEQVAPEEIRSRPAVRQTVRDLAVLSRGHLHTHVREFAAAARITL